MGAGAEIARTEGSNGRLSSWEELSEFLGDQQPAFIQDFEALFLISDRHETGQMKSLLEALWARYNALLALAEVFAGRADAAVEEMSRYVRKELE